MPGRTAPLGIRKLAAGTAAGRAVQNVCQCILHLCQTFSPMNDMQPGIRMETRTIDATLARQDCHLQRLVHGQQAFSRQWVEEHGDEDPALAAWLSAQLKLPDQPGYLTQAPPALRLPWEGWLAYYRGDYPDAAAFFCQAWDATELAADEASLAAADVALGFGKVYTRSGHWEAARAWLLLSLQLCRDHHRLFGLVQGYGALGELFLRAGQSQAAHAAMSTAFHLLPPGSGQQPRQLNYLASTLMRTGAMLRAQSLLMTSLHMAHDAGDADSVWHALARLQFLAIAHEGAAAPDVQETLGAYVPARVTPVAASFLHVGRAHRYWSRGDTTAARACLHRGLEALGSQGQALPCEQTWVERLIVALEGDGQTLPTSRPTGLLDLEPCLAPAVEGVVDRTWAGLPLLDDNGFAWLLTPVQDFEVEMARRSRFFI